MNEQKSKIKKIVGKLLKIGGLTFAEDAKDTTVPEEIEWVKGAILRNDTSKIAFTSYGQIDWQNFCILVLLFSEDSRERIYAQLTKSASTLLKKDLENVAKTLSELCTETPKLEIIQGGSIKFGADEFRSGIATDGTPGYKGQE